MKRILFFLLAFLGLELGVKASARSVLNGKDVKAEFASNGHLAHIAFTFNGSVRHVSFRNDKFAGPSFGENVTLSQIGSQPRFEGSDKGIGYALEYKAGDGCIDICAEVKNNTQSDFQPDRLPLYLGIDTYMDKYPQWNDQYYPTMLRCESNNFWGYFTTPKGDVLTVSSPDPVGCYRYEYLNIMYGHYIYTMTLDLLCNGPLPSHHPQPTALKPGETRTWTIRLQPAANLDEVLDVVAENNSSSMVTMNSHSFDTNHSVEISVNNQPAEIEITEPSGVVKKVGTASPGKALVYDNTAVCGLYKIKATNAGHKVSTASFYVHPSWSWYAERARENAMVFVPRSFQGNSSCETWYQLLGFYLAEKHLPDPSSKAVADQLLQKVLDRLFEEFDGKLRTSLYKERIQNVSAMLSVLSLKYSCDHDEKTLETARKCADFLLWRQHKDGYYGGPNMSHYTSVIYIAKSIMEFMDQIEPLAKKDEKWQKKYDEYGKSVERAVNELSHRGLDVKTEGQATFEDGSVSCSASQLLLFALRQKDDSLRNYYKKSGLDYLTHHACLARLIDPDCRSRGATSRFWEAWGDIRTPMQAMLSPHGWSAWRMYASYYAYLLTGEYERLQQFFDAMGACTQLLDYPSGELRWAFVVDPQYNGGRLLPDDKNPNGRFEPGVMQAGYLEQVGDWFGRNTEGKGYLDRSEWDWDGAGTTYEIFKAMEECVLPNAFICANGDEVAAYNCQVKPSRKALDVIVSDKVIRRIHVNLKKKQKVNVYRNGVRIKSFTSGKDMQWVGLEDARK